MPKKNTTNEAVILGLDQGSSSSKAVLIDLIGNIHWQASKQVKSNYLAEDKVEQDPEELYQTIKSLLDEAIQYCDTHNLHLLGFGLSCQRSGVLAWEKDGTVIHPLLTFRDKRSKQFIAQISKHHKLINKRTGLPCLADYAASKIALLQNKLSDSKNLIGTLDSFILYRLSKNKLFITEHSMAARTLLYSLESQSWDNELCEIFKVDQTRLAKIISSTPFITKDLPFPLLAFSGDGQAALFNVLDDSNRAVLNLGTISSLCLIADTFEKIPAGFLSGILCYKKSAKFLLEAVTNSSGAVITYLKDDLKIIHDDNEIKSFDSPGYFPELVAYLPIHGTATPDWRVGLANVFSDSLSGQSKQDIIAASIYSIGSFIIRNLKAAIDAGLVSNQQGKPLYVSGGLSKSDMLLNYIATVCNIKLAVLSSNLGSATGIAKLAAQASGEKLKMGSQKTIKIIEPDHNSDAPDYFKRWLKLEKTVLTS